MGIEKQLGSEGTQKWEANRGEWTQGQAWQREGRKALKKGRNRERAERRVAELTTEGKDRLT